MLFLQPAIPIYICKIKLNPEVKDIRIIGALGIIEMKSIVNVGSFQTKAVENTRSISKEDMVLNNHLPEIEVHPETYEVRADGELLTCEPAQELPMAQRYFLF